MFALPDLHLAILCCLPLCDPSIPVCVSHCPAAPINPKTHLGSPWSSQNPRRRKPLPLPLPDSQHPPIQALCPLSKGRAPDPARPLHPPTHSTRMTTRRKITRKRRAVKEVQFKQQLQLVTRGTASPRRLKQQVLTLPLLEEARPALPAPGAPRARNGQHLVLHSHLQVTEINYLRLCFHFDLSTFDIFCNFPFLSSNMHRQDSIPGTRISTSMQRLESRLQI